MASRFGDDPVEASPPAVSRFGDAPVSEPTSTTEKPGFFESAYKGSAIAQAATHPIDTLISLTGHKDLESAAELYKAGDKKAAAGKVLRWAATGGFVPVPGLRIGADMAQTAATKLSSAHAAFRNGKYEQALVDTASGVLPFLSSGIEGVQKIAHGDTAGGVGSIAGNVVDLAVPFVPKAGRAAVRGVRGAAAGAVEALAKPGVPEMATGAAEAAAGLGGIATGHPVAMGGGAYGVVQGAKTFAGGLAKRRAATVERIGAASQAAETARAEADAARSARLAEMVQEADVARIPPALPEQVPPMAGAVDVPLEAAGAPPGPIGAYQQYRQRTAAAMPSTAAPSFPESASRWGGAMPEAAVSEGFAAMRARRRGAAAPTEPPMAGEVPITRGGPVEENLLPAGEPRPIEPPAGPPVLPELGTPPKVTVIPQKLPQQTPEFYAAQNRGPRVAKLTDQLQEVMQADPSITIQSLRDITAHEPSRAGLAKSFKWERPPSAATMMQAITELEKRQQQATTLASPGIVERLAERGALGNAQELADLLK